VASLLRSVLFVPGTRGDRFAKAIASGADAVVLDLEDGVDPARKDEARRTVAAWLADAPASEIARFVRVNSAKSVWLDADLAWLPSVIDHIDAIVLPKTESPREVERVASKSPSRRVVALLETARGILAAGAIAGAHAEIPALMFGAEDLTAELGIPRTVAGDEILLARSQVVLAAATIGAEAVDAVFVDLKSPDRLREDAMRARALGFRGKMAIHPDQIAVIHEVFTPSAEEIAAAQRLIDADAAAHARGEGAFRLDDRMVDAPVIARAKKVLGTGLFSTDSAKKGRRSEQSS
jgi:citrate lyase subunit beta/citryl-CoA lyase